MIGHGEDRTAPTAPPGAFVRSLAEPQFWAIGVQYFFLVMIQSFYTTWLPTYLVSARHLSMKAMGVVRVPFIWFWPDANSSCAIMTHDVETLSGRDFCAELMDIDDSFGIKASFQIIPEDRYPEGYTF